MALADIGMRAKLKGCNDRIETALQKVKGGKHIERTPADFFGHTYNILGLTDKENETARKLIEAYQDTRITKIYELLGEELRDKFVPPEANEVRGKQQLTFLEGQQDRLKTEQATEALTVEKDQESEKLMPTTGVAGYTLGSM